MQKGKDILSELLEISELLASLQGKALPYEVPLGYWELFPASIIAGIREYPAPLAVQDELLAIAPALHQADKKNPLSPAPDNYFDSFPSIIIQIIKRSSGVSKSEEAVDELSSISPLLSGLLKKNPYEVPEGYFNELAAALVPGLQAVDEVKQELQKESPLTGARANVYEVPENYFENLPGIILQQAKQETPAKVISIRKNRSWLKYAVAAAVAGVIMIAGVLTFNNQPANHPVNGDDPATGLTKMSDQEITNYLSNHDLSMSDSTSTSTAANDFSDNDMNDLLGDVTDNELEQYAADHLSSKDLITN